MLIGFLNDKYNKPKNKIWNLTTIGFEEKETQKM